MGNSNEKETAIEDNIVNKSKTPEINENSPDAQKFGEFDQLFLRYDIDKNNQLQESEFINLLGNFTALKPQLSEHISDIKTEISIDQPLNRDEFRLLMYNCFSNTDMSERVIEVFKIFDKNAEHQLSCIEVMHVFNKLGLNLTIVDVEELFEEAIGDRNGILQFDDFMKILLAK